MPQICDSYSESNFAGSYFFTRSGRKAHGQSFTGDGNYIYSAKFYLQRSGFPTGNCYAKVYAHSGSYGSTSVPTGTPLAISDPLDVSTISSGSFSLIELIFSEENIVLLEDSMNYVIVFEFDGGDINNQIFFASDGTSPTHGGNKSIYISSWDYDPNGHDSIFYVYTQIIEPVTYTSPFPAFRA